MALRQPPTRMPLAASGLSLALVAIALAAFGHGRLWLSSDTPSYLDAARAAQPLGQMRLPLYGWLVAPILADPRLAQGLPWLQLAAFAAAMLWLVRALQRLGLSDAGCTAVGLALAGSNLVLLWACAALPEMFGHAAVLCAFAAAIDIAAGARPRWRAAAVIFGVTLGWALRPSLLPFVAMAPCLLLLPGGPAGRRRFAPALLLLIGCALPVLALSALRQRAVGDFNVVSFGGFQMSGMAALMLTPQIAIRLPPDDQPAALAILLRRAELEASGAAIATPPNSTGQRSFPSEAAGYFDILARTHDAVLYDAVGRLRMPDETWVSFNRRMQHLALAVVMAAPLDFATWAVGACARLVGHAVVLNAAFMLATALLIALSALQAMGLAPPPAAAPAPDRPILIGLSLIYLLGTCPLIVLTTFPAGRYIDSAALFLAAWPISALLRGLSAVIRPRD